MPTTASVSSNGSTALRIAIVGCGEVCEHKHFPALARVNGVRVTALVDSDPHRLTRVGDRYGISDRFPDLDPVLSRDLADIVAVLVPPAAHAAIAAQGLAEGRHVLVEKPIALSLDDADLIGEAARGSTGLVQMGLHMRWHRLVQRARDAIRAGAIGSPESIRTTWSSPRGDVGIPAWKTRRATGGGALVELGVHLFDLWRYLLDTEVTTVYARVRHGARQDESAQVTGVLANGVLASATLSERSAHEIEIEVAGSTGRLRVACQRFDGFELYARDETRGMLGPRLRGLVEFSRELPRGLVSMRRLGDYGDSYRGQWQGFVDAIRSRGIPACTIDDGRAALRVVLAACASVERGGPVRIVEAPRTLAGEPVDA